MDVKTRVAKAKEAEYCCSETIMKLGLEDLKIEDEKLIDAMGAFCGGMGAGQVCGALAASVSLMCVTAGRAVGKKEIRPEFMKWFGEKFGALDCPTLIDNDVENKKTRCPLLIEQTYEKVAEILKERGYI
ncbi:MAG: C-GCAxxG-C-C family protein [Clostridiales Family XIII bacterium]|jgi:C_GCAxxG_C_C family probable redox protein|nr:C-GCAxxG-C-C family protein [Clostridiales Family XIII bacterium]